MIILYSGHIHHEGRYHHSKVDVFASQEVATDTGAMATNVVAPDREDRTALLWASSQPRVYKIMVG